jgi:hypothetical protein
VGNDPLPAQLRGVLPVSLTISLCQDGQEVSNILNGLIKIGGNLMRNILRKIRHEFFNILPPTIFFFISFCLLILTHNLIVRHYGFPVVSFANAAVGALIVGKVVLIADNLSFIDKFPGKPLIYNTVWKTFVYMLIAVAVRFVERLIAFARQYGGISKGNRQLLSEITWEKFWFIMVWLSVLFFIFCGFREFVRVIGGEQVIRIFFRSPDKRELGSS